MQIPSIRLSRAWTFLVWCAVGVVLFWPVRDYYMALPSPDSPPFYSAAHRLRYIEQFLAGNTALSPHHLFSLLLPPLVHHDLIYLLDTLLIAAGCAYFLRGRGLPPVAAWIGGGILTFAGYSFTLISAGHMGFFHMTVYVTFMFGFLVRALRGDGWHYYALTGLFGAWAILFSPDFGFVFLLLAVVYGLWLLLRNATQQTWKARLRPLAPGIPVAALCFLLGAGSTIRIIFTEYLQKREQQIATTAPRPVATDADAGAAAADDPQSRWIFATNWSLHPEEIAEFVAPCLFGTQTGDPRAPYWGKLGRTLGWEQHRQGFANFRQHAIYLGGLQLMLAAFAVGCWWRERGFRVQGSGNGGRGTAGSAVGNAQCAVGSGQSAVGSDKRGTGDVTSSSKPCRTSEPASGAGRRASTLNVERSGFTDVPFWACVWIVGLFLAFGRHAPFYRLFYSLPYMSFLRAPVKFMRLVELATAVLAASGLAGLMQPGTRRLRGWTIGAGVCAGLALLAAGWANGADAAIAQALEPMGLARAEALLKGNLVHALLHGACAFGVAAAMFFLRSRPAGRLLPLIALAAAWIALDALLVNRRFIMAWDFTSYYQLNRVSRVVLSEQKHGLMIADYAAHGYERDWYNKSLWTRQIVNCVRSRQFPEEPCMKLMLALERDPVRFWRLAGAGHAVIPLGIARSLPAAAGKVADVFSVLPGRLADISSEADAMALFRVNNPAPYAWLSPSWRVVSDKEHFDALISQPDALAVPVVSGEADAGTETPIPSSGSLAVQAERYRGGAMRTVLHIQTPVVQMLTVRMPHDAGLAASVDGAEVPLLRSNHLWCGVAVPAGSHTVTLALRRNRPQAALAALPPALALLAVGFCLFRKNTD